MPDTITAIVASTGSSTARPGQGTDSSSIEQATTIPARPAHPSAARNGADSRSTAPAATASPAPPSSSPMRAGRRKNAHDGCWSVSHIPTTKPIAASAVTVTASSRRYCAGRRVSSTSSAGQRR